MKIFKSPDYNFIFDNKTGFFARWGKTEDDDPPFSTFGPEIIDMEISTVCSRGCSWCYKSNNYQGKNMSFKTFKKIFDKFPKHLTQIAFGVGDIDANKDLWKIMEYCRENNVVPNITINGDRMTTRHYNKLGRLCGAVAVSLYNKHICYDAVKELTDRGIQTNIHALLAKETFMRCYSSLLDRIRDERLDNMNAIVFLWLKPKGTRNHFSQVDNTNLKYLIKTAIDVGKPFGFDSCTAPMFLDAVKDEPEFEKYKVMTEPCESTLFSYYINCEGVGFPCSFCEDNYNGINILEAPDFLEDVWQHQETVSFRNKVLNSGDCNGCRTCVEYKLGT